MGVIERADKPATGSAQSQPQVQVMSEEATLVWCNWFDQRFARNYAAHWRAHFDLDDRDSFINGVLKIATEVAFQDVDAATAELRKEHEEKLSAMEKRLKGVAGRLPQVKVWSGDGAVAYEGELFSHGGSLWQARHDTGVPPPGPHWACMARGASIDQRDDIDHEASEHERLSVRDEMAEAISELQRGREEVCRAGRAPALDGGPHAGGEGLGS